jgi:hypothetical protein
MWGILRRHRFAAANLPGRTSRRLTSHSYASGEKRSSLSPVFFELGKCIDSPAQQCQAKVKTPFEKIESCAVYKAMAPKGSALMNVSAFLTDRFGKGSIRLWTLTPADVARFLMRYTQALVPRSVKAVGKSLRCDRQK